MPRFKYKGKHEREAMALASQLNVMGAAGHQVKGQNDKKET